MWTLIHNLPMQPKTRMFLWRATSDILPIGRNLMRRGLYDSLACVHCGFAVEDDRHALFYYKFSKELWRHLPRGHKWIQILAQNFKDLFIPLLLTIVGKMLPFFPLQFGLFCTQEISRNMKVLIPKIKYTSNYTRS